MEKQQHLVRELISNIEGSTFNYKQENDIWPVWHFHPEIDILLFTKDNGQHITGDCHYLEPPRKSGVGD